MILHFLEREELRDCHTTPPLPSSKNLLILRRTLPETNSSPLKIGFPKRKSVFQPYIFRCYVGFKEGILLKEFLSGLRSSFHHWHHLPAPGSWRFSSNTAWAVWFVVTEKNPGHQRVIFWTMGSWKKWVPGQTFTFRFHMFMHYKPEVSRHFWHDSQCVANSTNHYFVCY